MKKVSRRTFFSGSLGAAAALSLPATLSAKKPHSSATGGPDTGPDIIDTNVNLFQWPFRRLKYGETKALVAKLRQHRITQAWAGSYEGLLHKDINGVNSRLAEECRVSGEGMLLPFGTVNLAWPDWEEDLRKCHEVYGMRGIRLCPIYQTFDLDHPDFPKLVRQATAMGLAIQIVGDMEDSRTHHPIILVREMNVAPLVDIMKAVPMAKVQLLHWNQRVRRNLLDKLINETSVALDISRIEGTGELGRLIEGKPWSDSAMAIPVERFLFGSHAPYFPVETNVLKLFESPLTLEQMKAIMSGNARRFLGSV
ncbi:MAG TPA: amidohydrolase family protein [Cyclobacteriaceae bacterium]|nr:amidohydrolase family protein [Cyclobacteriaceae bacterium]